MADSLRQCLLELARADTTGDYDSALKTANKILRKFPKETVAFKCKVVAFIQLGMYDDAAALIKKTPSHQMGDVSFERAYLSYRRNENEQALSELESCDSKDVRAIELKAQLFYRMEKFQEAYDLLVYLLKNHSDDYDGERKANLLAAQAQLESMGVRVSAADECDSFEQLFNAACADIEAGEYNKALQKLDQAQDECRETLTEEGLEAAEIEDELAGIRVQRAFCLHKLGDKAEALKLYTAIHSRNPTDVSVLATVANNIPAASAEPNLPDARKRLRQALAVDQNKLTNRQKRTLMINNALVLLLSNQQQPCRRALDELKAKYGEVEEALPLEAALMVKAGEVDEAVKTLSGKDAESALTRLHYLVNAGRAEAAVAAARALPGQLATAPATVSLVVALLQSQGKHKDALAALSTAVASSSGAAKAVFLDKAAALAAEAGDHQAAAKLLEQLAGLQPGDMAVQCRLMSAYSHFDTAKAEKLSAKVFPSSSVESVDTDELEESDWILYGDKYKHKKEAKTEMMDTEIVTGKLRNRRKKRKVILPKNYDPSAAPDPERWLPKCERAAYKKKIRKRDYVVGRGTQGSASGAPVTYQVHASPKPTPIVEEGPRVQRGAQKNKKKGKK